MENQQEVFIKMVLDAWHSKTNQFDKLLSELSDEQLLKEVSPGRNRGIYLLGHLTVMVNAMLPLLGYDENPTPHLIPLFVRTPDREVSDLPTANELRQEWAKAKALIERHIATTAPNEWFQKHTSISEEDFAKQPHRNKLNVVLSRASHFDYHLGQLIFLKSNK
jgi:DinB superfamily